MHPTADSDLIPLENLRTDAQVGAVQELRADIEENILAAEVSGADTYVCTPPPATFLTHTLAH